MDFPSLPHLTLDGTIARLEINPVDVRLFYQPLAKIILQKAGESRFVIGVAGPPGCGKTAFTAILCAVINACAGLSTAVCIGLDGWHYPNSYLDSHYTIRNGQEIRLRMVKGAPESYDTEAAISFLRAARNDSVDRFPVYSRTLHDPIPQAGHLERHNRILLMEGNYLLLDSPIWRDFHPLLDLSIFLTAPREQLIAALRHRHLAGGKRPDVVEQHILFSDLPNLDLILAHSRPADILVEKVDSRRISKILFPKNI